jgi:hypothetical protein
MYPDIPLLVTRHFMSGYAPSEVASQKLFDVETNRLEAVTVSVGFDDLLDVTLAANHQQVDHQIVVTSHDDSRTHAVVRKHGATLVQTDLFQKNGRNFNKGAAINAGMDYFQYHGWRMCWDADIVLPDSFRRMLFTKTHLDRSTLYGCDRVDVVGREEWHAIRNHNNRQHSEGVFVGTNHHRALSPRYVDNLSGYCPLGFFQMWHASCQKPYPFSLGTAAHDDVMFARLWPQSHRVLLPSVVCYHLCSKEPQLGENWEGNRTQPRF